jgi:hypothetical protein
MNGSARPAYEHYLVYILPFDLTDRLETSQQTLDTARFQKVDPFFGSSAPGQPVALST